ACPTRDTDRDGSRHAAGTRTASGIEATRSPTRTSITMSVQTHRTLEALRLAIHGVTAPFSAAGTFVPGNPVTLVFEDQTRFEVRRARSSYEQQGESKQLLAHCAPAPFGHQSKTR